MRWSASGVVSHPTDTYERKKKSAFRPAEVSTRRRLQAASRGADPFKASLRSLATEECPFKDRIPVLGSNYFNIEWFAPKTGLWC